MHLKIIREVVKELSITHEDVCMRLLAMSFQGTVECWFLNLTANSIFGYEMFEQKFLEEWGNEFDNMNILDQKTTELSRSGKEPFSPDKVKLSSNSDEYETCNQLVEDSFSHSPQMDRFSFEVFLQEQLTKFPSIRKEVMAYLLNHPSASQDDIFQVLHFLKTSMSTLT